MSRVGPDSRISPRVIFCSRCMATLQPVGLIFWTRISALNGSSLLGGPLSDRHVPGAASHPMEAARRSRRTPGGLVTQIGTITNLKCSVDQFSSTALIFVSHHSKPTRLIVYCADYKCAHSVVIDAGRWSDDVRLSPGA